jgi:anti-anti-sigma factor
VRGSIPTPLSNEQFQDKLFQALINARDVNLSDPAEVNAYIASLPPTIGSVVGGNTACVEIDTGAETIIVDCGSGMRELGLHLMGREFGRGQGTAHIFLTHAHWDHLQGYPFFAPAYVPGNRLIFYAVNHNPQQYLEHQQVAPIYFPISPNSMAADKEFVQLREGETVQIGRLMISNLGLLHPGVAFAYRFDDGESVFVFASDGEYKQLSDAHLRRYTSFYADADALVFDAQYSLRDVFLSRADWGHSSAIIGVDIAERARVKKLITFHHDPTHSDEQIHNIANGAREYAAVNQHTQTEIIVGTEGLELFLGEPPGLETVEERQDEIWTLAMAGQLNAATVAEAQKHLSQMLTETPNNRLILDLTLLSAADTIGLKGIVDVVRAAAGAHLAVLAPAAHIRRLFEQLGAHDVVQVARSRQQALATLADPAHLQLSASKIGGQYHMQDLLFVDDLGAVYRGLDLTTHEALVVRVVAGGRDNAARARFLDDLRHWQTLRDIRLVTGRAIIEADEWVAFVCPKPMGRSLAEWLVNLPTGEELWQICEQLCQAVAAIHKQGQVHGDLHPENIYISEGGAMLTRMPLFPSPADYSANAYQAPEQLYGKPATQRTDVYALGLLLYEIFIGAHPFSAESEELRLTLKLYSQPQSPRLRWSDMPVLLENLLLQMLARDPDERYPTAREVLGIYSQLTPTARLGM